MNDFISDVLGMLSLKATLYFRTEFYPPFGVAVPMYKRAARFHFIVQGCCFIRLGQDKIVVGQPGDLVLVPHGVAHVLASDAKIQCKPLADVIAEAGFTGSGPFVIGNGPPNESCQMISGHFTFAAGTDHPLLRAVPEALHISANERTGRPVLDEVLQLLVRVMFEEEPGTNATISRLSEVLYIEIIRAGLNQAPDIALLMQAADDPQIGKALMLIHREVGAAWTIANLAQSVGLSRTGFAQRFRTLIGDAPMAYIGELRLQCALKLLQRPDSSVKLVASQVGYRSTAAFTRAFTARFGHPPRRYHLMAEAS